MQFDLKPSLEHIALVKIGISLWNQNDITALISQNSYRSLNEDEWGEESEWEEISERVIDKVSHLSLPELLKKKLVGIIKPIGTQIFEWMKYYLKYDGWIEFHCHLDHDLPTHLPAELCWTPQGTVDKKRTAEVLLGDENLNVVTRYMLACDYCLEGDIIRFWNSLPENVKNYDWENFSIVNFWSNNMKGGGADHISYKDAFHSSVGNGNKVASKYFLQKLTPQEREESLEDLEDADVLCFLLSEMEEEEQKKALKNIPDKVLLCFLQWPWQSLFIGVADCIWDFLSKENCYNIFGHIIGKVIRGYKDYNYQELFREFWQKSPSAIKDSVIDDGKLLLEGLFYIKDKENIRLILKDVTLAAKSKLIYNWEIGSYMTCCIREDYWDFLKFFIQECLPSKNEILKFKEEFEKRMYFKQCSAEAKQRWNLMLSFSDDSICKHSKRSVEEGENSSSKRFQSIQ